MHLENRIDDEELRLTTTEEVIGIFLNDPIMFGEFYKQLTPIMFGKWMAVFTTMVDLHNKGGLSKRALYKDHSNKMEELEQISNLTLGIDSKHIPFYISKMKKETLARELRGISFHINMNIGEDADGLLGEVKQKISDLNNTEVGDAANPDSDVDEFYEWMDKIVADPSQALGMMTGLDDLDRITTGFHKGDFIVVGARTSMGKSAFMLEMALRLTRKGYKVAIFSLEMSKRQIYLRLLANLMTLDLKTLKTGRILASRMDELRSHKAFLKQIYVDDTRMVSSEYIIDSMRRLKNTSGLDVVMTDYIQEVKEEGESNDNQGSAIARVCRKLRKGAQECDVAMFGLSQVVRAVEDRQDKHPMSSDLSGSTGIETSADAIIMLYRDEYYNPSSEKKEVMEATFTKHRNGELGKVEFIYKKEYQQLRSINGGRY